MTEATTEVKKDWYKTWWGILILVLFFPVALPAFGIWYIWTKNKLNKPLRWAVTIVLSLIIIGVLSSFGSKPTTTTTDTAKTTPAPTKEVAKTKEATVFDVPALLGKNIDEVRVVLGTPDDKKSGMDEPNAQQLALGTDSWDNTFTKGNDTILVTFNPVTRKVIDYFLSGNNENGENKQHLIEIGNLNESDSKYKIVAVKMIKDPSKITGITVTPK
jgi:hypothetical protein